METSTVLHNEEIIANKKKFSAQTVAICTMAVVIAVMAIMLLVLLTDTKTDDESSISSLLDAPLFDDNGLLAAQSDGRWGFINDKGEWVVNPQFAWVGEFTEQGLCVVRNEEQYGYIGLDGKYIINPQFETDFHFDKPHGTAVVCSGKNMVLSIARGHIY